MKILNQKSFTTVLHKSNERIVDDFGWLKIQASFRDSAVTDHQKKFGALVIVDDAMMIPGGRGFELHPHDNIEVISYILSGTDRHTDDQNGIQKLMPGDVQLMSAGTGIQHSDGNDSDSEPVFMFQIWVLPAKRDIKPSYQKMSLKNIDCKNKFYTFITPSGARGSMQINQDAYFSYTQIDTSVDMVYHLNQPSNGLYLMVLSGQVEVEKFILSDKDAIGISDIASVAIRGLQNSELWLMEVPMLE